MLCLIKKLPSSFSAVVVGGMLILFVKVATAGLGVGGVGLFHLPPSINSVGGAKERFGVRGDGE
jgi:hypothetical protein